MLIFSVRKLDEDPVTHTLPWATTVTRVLTQVVRLCRFLNPIKFAIQDCIYVDDLECGGQSRFGDVGCSLGSRFGGIPYQKSHEYQPWYQLSYTNDDLTYRLPSSIRS